MADSDHPASTVSPGEKLTGTGDNRALVTIVEDEEDIAGLLEIHLARAGFRTMVFPCGNAFLEYLNGNTPDLAILDIMLPDGNGTDICRAIRASERHGSLPVIILTALGHETERVLGLELGADDYIVKPFSPRELVARVRAVLRRSRAARGVGKELRWEGLTLFPEAFEALLNGVSVDLTPTEFRILHALVEGGGRVITRSGLLELLWEGEKFVFERTVDVHIAHIRQKLGEAGGMVKSVRGIGYRMER